AGGARGALGPGRERPRLAGGDIPGKQWGDEPGWARGTLSPARTPRAVQSAQGALGGAGPGPPLATAPFGWAPPAHALGTPGPLLRRDRTAPLHEPWSMRGIPPRPRDTLAPP